MAILIVTAGIIIIVLFGAFLLESVCLRCQADFCDAQHFIAFALPSCCFNIIVGVCCAAFKFVCRRSSRPYLLRGFGLFWCDCLRFGLFIKLFRSVRFTALCFVSKNQKKKSLNKY